MEAYTMTNGESASLDATLLQPYVYSRVFAFICVHLRFLFKNVL